MPADGAQAQTANGDSAPRVLCAGIIVLDEVFRVDEFPRNDGKVEAEAFFAVNGGCAANAAVAVARLVGRATLAAPLGGPAGVDENGDRVLAALSGEAIDISACQRVEGLKTALSAIFINARRAHYRHLSGSAYRRSDAGRSRGASGQSRHRARR